jgi:hypothetical protein
MRHTLTSISQQQGFTLPLTLVMLISVTLVALTAAGTALQGERSSGNYRQQNIATTSAESGLVSAATRIAQEALDTFVNPSSSEPGIKNFSAGNGGVVNLALHKTFLFDQGADAVDAVKGANKAPKLPNVQNAPDYRIGFLSMAPLDGYEGNVKVGNFEVGAQAKGNTFKDASGNTPAQGPLATVAGDYTKVAPSQ